MKKLILISLILPVLFFAGCIGPGPVPEPHDEYPISFNVFQEGIESGVTEKTYFVINNENEMNELYQKIHNYTKMNYDVPEVDFSKYTLIAVFMGEQPSKDYELKVDRVMGLTGIKKYINVYVQERVPQGNLVVEYNSVQPFEIIQIKKTDLDIEVIRKTIEVIPGHTEEQIDFSVVEKEIRSGITERKEIVVNNLDEWENLYSEIRSWQCFQEEGVECAPMVLPFIDFDRYTVIGVFAGEKMNGNYGVEINKIVRTKSGFIVYVQETYNKPAPGTGAIQVTVQPYELVKIKKTDLPVDFEWKEIIIIPVEKK
ncbi:MAG: hypothetical protein COT90_00300 [Candidatus Diapherotrites archaeon CG10_big_fil_rev_8_21_14_0_10_31_34]|nr:MAG: hypothetical protein COT90_00300 [Candidatus Diapherotrites archaeon CG10_big_fil_rev_8_21_14_0_10_31_34]